MGFFDWLLGDDDPAPQTATTTSVNEVPSYISQPHERTIQSAERLAGQEYPTYQGARVADFTGDQQNAMQSARNRMGVGIGQLQTQYDTAAGTTGPLTGQEISGYMNPYLDQVGGQASRELQRGFDQEMLGVNDAASKAGAFGGARHGIVESETRRNQGRTMSDMYERLYASGYDKATDLAGKMRAQNLQGAMGAGQLAQAGQSSGMQDVNMGLGIGSLQQEMGQQNLNLAYEDFQKQQDYPWMQLGKLGNVMNSAPYSTTTSSTATTPGVAAPGFLQTAAGLGIQGLGMAGNMGWKPFA